MPLVENEDYYIDVNGLLVFTSSYLLARGYCCGNGCRHCPYGTKEKPPQPTEAKGNEKNDGKA